MNISGKINGGSPEGERHGSDFYPTPPEPIHALLNYLQLPAGAKIWEPACGEGDMSEVLSAQGYDVEPTDVRSTGYGTGNVDFLEASPRECDWIITNPPFCLAEDFIRKAWGMGIPFAYLLKIQYFCAAKRAQLFRDCPPTEILPLTFRVDFLFKEPGKRSSPPMDVMWVVWRSKNEKTETIYKLLEKPKGGK